MKFIREKNCQKELGFVHVFVILLLLAGLIVAVYLTQQTQIFRSRAGSESIVFKDLNGQTLPAKNGIPQTTVAKIRIEISSPLGPPQTGTTTSLNTVTGKVVSTIGGTEVSPATTVTTVSYKITEDLAGLTSSLEYPYLKDPTAVDYTFKNQSLGQKFIWVEFKDSTGKTDRRTAQVELASIQAAGSSVLATEGQFAVAGRPTGNFSNFYYYIWDNMSDPTPPSQTQAAPNHRFSWIVGKFDNRHDGLSCVSCNDINIQNIYNAEEPKIRKLLTSPNNKGGVWIVGNEANFKPRVSSVLYAQQFKKYQTLIKGLDSTAKLANSGLVYDRGWIGSQAEDPVVFLRAFLNELSSRTYWPDIYNVHYYPNDVRPSTNVDQARTFKQYINSTDPGKPIWVTEFGMDNRDALEGEAATYMNTMINAFIQEKLADRWFWFISASEPGWEKTALTSNEQLTTLGRNYLSLRPTPPPTVAIKMPTFTPAPTSSSWKIQATPYCTNKITPTGKGRLFYTLWPPTPLVWKYDSLTYQTGAHSINITSNATGVQGIYVGLETDQQVALSPIGNPSHQAIIYSTFFNPPTLMAKWQKSDLPSGSYGINFQAPDSWCVAPASVVGTSAPSGLKQSCTTPGISIFSWIAPATGVAPTAYAVRINKLADVWWPSDTTLSGDFVAGPTGTTYNAVIAPDKDYAWSVQAYPYTATAPRRTNGGRFICTSAGVKIQMAIPGIGQADSPTNLTVNCGSGGKSASFVWKAPATGVAPSQYTLRVDKNQDIWFPTRTDVSGDFVAGVTGKSYTSNVAINADYEWSVQAQPNNGTGTDRRTEGGKFRTGSVCGY